MICVMTTIRGPSPSVHTLAAALRDSGDSLLVIGDAAGPARYDVAGAQLFTLNEQRDTGFELARLLPVRHYARKNIGYLLAFRRRAECIYETDDDNAPLKNWQPREMKLRAQRVSPRPWFNVYRAFTDEYVWPRGFPLSQVADPAGGEHEAQAPLEQFTAPIQQGLADGEPDVDAVWRLVFRKEVFFQQRPSVWLPRGTWCPFNSQSTWWWPVAYPLMYLPSFCSMRMTDIWRSFVAQRCLWELDCGLVFHAAEVVQQRNAHDLMRDFSDEMPGYQGNESLAASLEKLSLKTSPEAVGDNLLTCYECLVEGGYLPEDELPLVRMWLDECGATGADARATTGG